MALPKILVDSSFLYALFRKPDPDHLPVRAVFQTVKADFIIPQVVLPEAAWLFNRAGGMPLVHLQDEVDKSNEGKKWGEGEKRVNLREP